jgi:hypothetical protein
VQQAFALRAEVRDDSECHAAVAREPPEEAFHRGNAAGGSADTDDGKFRRSAHQHILGNKERQCAASLFDADLS